MALYDGEAEVTGESIKQVLVATGNEVAPYWPDMFAGIFKDGNIEKLVFARGGGGKEEEVAEELPLPMPELVVMLLRRKRPKRRLRKLMPLMVEWICLEAEDLTIKRFLEDTIFAHRTRSCYPK